MISVVKSATIDAPGIKGAIARKAFDTKLRNLKETGAVTHPVWDRIVMRKVKAVLGGNLCVRALQCCNPS